MLTSSMHMLELPSVFVRADLPNRTFLTIKGIDQWHFLRNKLNSTSSVLDDTWVLQLRRDEGDGA